MAARFYKKGIVYSDCSNIFALSGISIMKFKTSLDAMRVL